MPVEGPGGKRNTWDKGEFNPPRKEDRTYAEAFLADFDLATARSTLLETRDYLDKLAEKYPLKVNLDDQDIKNLISFGEVLRNKGLGIEMVEDLRAAGIDMESVDLLLVKAKIIPEKTDPEIAKPETEESEPTKADDEGGEIWTTKELADDLRMATYGSARAKKDNLEGPRLKAIGKFEQKAKDYLLNKGLNPNVDPTAGDKIRERWAKIDTLATALEKNNLTQEQRSFMKDELGIELPVAGAPPTEEAPSPKTPAEDETKKTPVEQLIEDNEENYNQIFLNTKRSNNDGHQDNAERFHSRHILTLAGYDENELNVLDDQVKNDLLNGDTKSLDNLFTLGREVYLSTILGTERFKKFVKEARDISRLKSDLADTKKMEADLKKNISNSSIEVTDSRKNWSEEMRKRLVGSLKEEFRLFDIDIVAARSDLNMIRQSLDSREKQKLAKRWEVKYSGDSDSNDLKEMRDEVKEFSDLGPDQISEVEMGDSEAKKELEANIRMAMIDELLSAKIHPNLNIRTSFESFVSEQARRYGGMGKNHFPEEYQKGLETEYTARMELAKILAYWDGNPTIDEEGLKTMPLISRSSYEWLAKDESKLIYKEVGSDGVSEVKERNLRTELDQAAKYFYMDMLAGNIETWNTRGETRGRKLESLVAEWKNKHNLDVSLDALRLVWQLSEAECWQAKQGVGFVSHKAGKLVVFANVREFQARKGMSVIGGNRIWKEWLNDHKDVYPDPKKHTNIFLREGGRLARVGCEAWSIRIDGEEGDTRKQKGVRNGQRWLFGEDGQNVPDQLLKFEVGGKNYDLSNDGDGRKTIDEVFVDEPDRTQMLKTFERAVGGEKFLLDGQYFSKMEAFLKQPAITDDDLPQTVVKDDMLKASAVVKAIEAFGEIDATKASLENLDKVRSALVSLKFRTNGHDLVERDTDVKKIRKDVTVVVRGKPYEWNIPNGTQERNAKALLETGQLMEEWTKSFIFLLSWQNPLLKSENKVVGMGDWINLARSVGLLFDGNHQWGQYVGYGYGNRNGNELATNPDGTHRQGPTEESKKAAREFVDWFDKIHLQIVGKLRRKNFSYLVTEQRIAKDLEDTGVYGGKDRFWKGKWW